MNTFYKIVIILIYKIIPCFCNTMLKMYNQLKATNLTE